MNPRSWTPVQKFKIVGFGLLCSVLTGLMFLGLLISQAQRWAQAPVDATRPWFQDPTRPQRTEPVAGIVLWRYPDGSLTVMEAGSSRVCNLAPGAWDAVLCEVGGHDILVDLGTGVPRRAWRVGQVRWSSF